MKNADSTYFNWVYRNYSLFREPNNSDKNYGTLFNNIVYIQSWIAVEKTGSKIARDLIKKNWARFMKRHPNVPASAWRFLERLTLNPSVEGLILFGSRAFGDHDDRSDVDVAVCGASISRLDWARFRSLAYEADSLYWISLVHFDRNPHTLKSRITDTGVTIYVRTKTD